MRIKSLFISNSDLKIQLNFILYYCRNNEIMKLLIIINYNKTYETN